jgi:hypothetical protein
MYVTLVKSKHLNHENEAQYSQSDILSGRVYYNTKARLFYSLVYGSVDRKYSESEK